MAAVIQIQEALEKLANIPKEVKILRPRLKTEIKSVCEELNKLKAQFAKKVQYIEPDNEWEIRCLQCIYDIQDTADTFLIKSLLQRRKGVFKIRPFVTLVSIMNQYELVNKTSVLTLNVKNLTDQAANLSDKGHKSGSGSANNSGVTPHAGANAGSRKPARLWGEDEAVDAVGFGEEAESLCARLVDNNEGLDVIAILGEPGSGKTTLAKMVYNRAEIRKNIKRCTWIQDPITFSRSNPRDDDMYSNYLFRMGGFLIVVEDVNNMETWNEVRQRFPQDCDNNSKLLITTNNPEVAQQASKNPIQLHPLSDEDTWKLFLRKVGITEDDFNNSELNNTEHFNLKEIILRQCEGLPLAIVILGRFLSTKELSSHEWLKMINEHATNFLGQDQSVYSRIFALSFDNLSDDLKSCFFYLTLFPREYEIPVRRLVRLWTAERLICENPSAEQRPEDVAEEYFKTLVHRNLIEVTQRGFKGRAKKCRIVGSIYDIILAKSTDLGYVYVHQNDNSMSASGTSKSPKYNVRRLAQYSDIKSYPSTDSFTRYIRSYISFNKGRRDSPTIEVGTLLNRTIAKRGFGLLRVIDLEGVYKPMLPETIGKHLHLRYLGLRWTFLDSLPMSVGELPLLETLDIKHTSISELPSSIWKAKNLRHIYMNEVQLDISIEMKFGESLANLQTLWGLVIGAKSPMANALRLLINLRKLGLTCHSKSTQTVVESISALENLQSLRLRSVDEHGIPSSLTLRDMRHQSKLTDLYLLGVLTKPLVIDELPVNLETLTLSLSELKEDPMPMLGKLPSLRILKLYGNSYVGKLMCCLSQGFPSLSELRLWKLENLETWVVLDGAMPELKQLDIRCCHKLSIDGELNQLKSLSELNLTNMPEAIVRDLKMKLDGSQVIINQNNR